MPIIISGPRLPTGPARVPTRYLRVIGMPVRDKWFGLAELQVADSAGGPNLATSATASSVLNPAAAPSVNDGNPNTEWVATLNSPVGWTDPGDIIVDFVTPIMPYEIRITSVNDANFWRTVRCFSVQVSNDVTFSTYQLVGLFSTGDWAQNETRTFILSSVPLASTLSDARAWRLRSTANNGNGVATSIAELIFAASPGGPQLATGGVAFHGNLFGVGPSTAYIGASCFDNDLNSFGLMLMQGPVFFGYLFPSPPPTIQEIRIAPRPIILNEATKDGVIEWSCDLINWTTYGSYSGITSWTPYVYNSVAVP